MKLRLLTAGLVTCVTLGMFQAEASAESNWASKCENIPSNGNPTFQQMNCLLTNAAIDADIPPEVVKAMATQENDWKHFDENGKPIISGDGGIGLMQITNKDKYNQEKLKYDIYYNIEAGIEILNSMYDERGDLPKIKGAGRDVIENWYFPVMAYNGIKPVNSPLYKEDTDTHKTGDKNIDAYQEQVFAYIEKESFLNTTEFLTNPILGQYPFKTTDFQYDTNSDKNIEFQMKEYTLTNQMHTSNYFFEKGDKVFVTNANEVKLRKSHNTASAVVDKLNKNKILTINGSFEYDDKNNNQFVWYPVLIDGSKVKGYISSAYIASAPTVNTVANNQTAVSGKAPTQSTILIMKGNTQIASTTADTSGNFITKIPKQKAGTKLTIKCKDQLNTPIPSIEKIVIDKTPPKTPVINPIKKTTTLVTGKTEAYATVHLKIGSKTYPGSYKTKRDGKFKFSVKPLKAGTNIYITATDAANNKSTTTTKVQ